MIPKDDEFEAHRRRRAQATEAIVARTGIDAAMIDRLVRGFYGRIRDEPGLGPIFAARIADWEPHLQTMMRFWSSVALLSGDYHGRPMEKHIRLPIDGAHFARWLAVFAQTARDLCPPAAADHFIERAEAIAESLAAGVARFGPQQ